MSLDVTELSYKLFCSLEMGQQAEKCQFAGVPEHLKVKSGHLTTFSACVFDIFTPVFLYSVLFLPTLISAFHI